MAVITLLPSASRGAGTVSFGPFTIPDGLSQFTLNLDCSQHLDPARTITLILEISTDGGANYKEHSRFVYVGQPVPQSRPPDNTPHPNCILSNVLPAGTTRRGRGSHTITGTGSVTTSATIDVI